MACTLSVLLPVLLAGATIAPAYRYPLEADGPDSLASGRSPALDREYSNSIPSHLHDHRRNVNLNNCARGARLVACLYSASTSACRKAAFFDDKGSCVAVQECGAGVEEDGAPTPTSDRTCKACIVGSTFSDDNGSCVAIRECGAGVEEDAAPTASSDRTCSSISTPGNPNILLILVDDLGWADLQINNPESFYDTPNVEKLAADGAVFTNAYSPNPICSPSRTGLLTGRHPTQFGCTHYSGGSGAKKQTGGLYVQAIHGCELGAEDPKLLTIADAFQQNGYRTALAGKWHVGTLAAKNKRGHPTAHGFEIFIAGAQAADAYKGGTDSYFPPYSYQNGKCTVQAPCDIDFALTSTSADDGVKCDICQHRNFTTLATETTGTPDDSRSTSTTAAGRKAGDYLTRQLAQASADRMELMHRSGRPFFMYHSFFAVHTPIQTPKEVVATYDAKLSALYPDSPTHTSSWHKENAFGNGLEYENQPDPGKPRWGRYGNRMRLLQTNTEYAGMVKEMDDAVGVLLDKLDDIGIADETVVVFTSDNGGLSTAKSPPTSNLPLRGGKGWVYDGGIRVPSIIRFPGVVTAGVYHAPTTLLDLFPTLLDLAGLEQTFPARSNDGDGISQAPAITAAYAESKSPRHLVANYAEWVHQARALYWHYPHYSNQGGFPGGAIRIEEWKLVERYEDGAVELYNLQDDSGERHDMLASPNQPQPLTQAVAQAMRLRLHGWYERVGAKFLQNVFWVNLTTTFHLTSPWRPGYEAKLSPARTLRVSGACAAQSALNADFLVQGVTADNRTFYQSEDGTHYLYFDTQCNDGAPAMWIFDSSKPNTTAASDLDHDGACANTGKSNSGDWLPPTQAVWQLQCTADGPKTHLPLSIVHPSS